jgi:hypothetical protein
LKTSWTKIVEFLVHIWRKEKKEKDERNDEKQQSKVE